MAVFRVEKTRDYTVMANYHLKDRNLSLKAKGLLSLILSLPDNWNFNIKGLSKLSSDGPDSVASGITELKKAGFVTCSRVRNAKGQVGDMEYTINEKPMTENPEQEKPEREKPVQENPTQLNTNELTDLNKSITNQSIRMDGSGLKNARVAVIKENIEYDVIVFDRPYEKQRIDEIVEIMCDVFFVNTHTIHIGDRNIPTEVVRSQMMKLSRSHILYVLDLMNECSADIKNIRNYILAVLYNAPSTMKNYYAAKVNFDMHK